MNNITLNSTISKSAKAKLEQKLNIQCLVFSKLREKRDSLVQTYNSKLREGFAIYLSSLKLRNETYYYYVANKNNGNCILYADHYQGNIIKAYDFKECFYDEDWCPYTTDEYSNIEYLNRDLAYERLLENRDLAYERLLENCNYEIANKYAKLGYKHESILWALFNCKDDCYKIYYYNRNYVNAIHNLSEKISVLRYLFKNHLIPSRGNTKKDIFERIRRRKNKTALCVVTDVTGWYLKSTVGDVLFTHNNEKNIKHIAKGDLIQVNAELDAYGLVFDRKIEIKEYIQKYKNSNFKINV